jgi:hypothetical protein
MLINSLKGGHLDSLASPEIFVYYRVTTRLPPRGEDRFGRSGKEFELMSNLEKTPPPGDQAWAGFREIDRAIAENRVTSYTWKKTWADPWGRLKLILVFAGLIAFISFVIIYDFVL